MKTKSAFTLMELLVVMTIAGILAGVSISGYMGTLRVERRQDAILSLQKAWLTIQSTADGQTPAISSVSNSGFYKIAYLQSGFSKSDLSGASFLVEEEKLILQATAIIGKGQDKDKDDVNNCTTIYLSDQNKIYPENCNK